MNEISAANNNIDVYRGFWTDVNGDMVVDQRDYIEVLRSVGHFNPMCDFNRDGVVDEEDVLIFQNDVLSGRTLIEMDIDHDGIRNDYDWDADGDKLHNLLDTNPANFDKHFFFFDINGKEIDDIQQGSFGDCALLASIVSILEHPDTPNDPERSGSLKGNWYLENKIRVDEKGYIIVTLFDNVLDTYVDVKVSQFELLENAEYADSSPGVNAIELAYSKLKFKQENGYFPEDDDTIPYSDEQERLFGYLDRGDSPETTLEMLTGLTPAKVKAGDYDQTELRVKQKDLVVFWGALKSTPPYDAHAFAVAYTNNDNLALLLNPWDTRRTREEGTLWDLGGFGGDDITSMYVAYVESPFDN